MWQLCLLITECVCATQKLFLRSLILKVPGGLKSQQTLTTLPFCLPVRLSEVILALGTSKWVFASAYERVVLLREVRNVEFSRELSGLQFGVRLWEVSVSGDSTC